QPSPRARGADCRKGVFHSMSGTIPLPREPAKSQLRSITPLLFISPTRPVHPWRGSEHSGSRRPSTRKPGKLIEEQKMATLTFYKTLSRPDPPFRKTEQKRV